MSAYDQLLGVGDLVEIGGGVEILGDRAIAVADIDNPAKYLEGKYTIEDRIDVGFLQNASILTAAGTAGATLLFTAVCSSPFKPLEFIVDSSVALDLSIVDVKIASSTYIESAPVPAAVYSEVSLARRISWRTVQTTVPIQVTVRNDSANSVMVKMCVRGFRLT